MSYATADEVGLNLGRPLTQQETDQVGLWIEWAQATISRRMGNLADLDPSILKMVLVESVTARLRRPDDATQITTRVDDASVSRSYSPSSSMVEIRPEWWAALGWVDMGAFTVTPHGER